MRDLVNYRDGNEGADLLRGHTAWPAPRPHLQHLSGGHSGVECLKGPEA